MVKEAEKHAEEDRKKRELVDLKNQADSLIYSTEKNLKDVGDKVPAGDREAIEKAAADLREALGSDDHEKIRWFSTSRLREPVARPEPPGPKGAVAPPAPARRPRPARAVKR